VNRLARKFHGVLDYLTVVFLIGVGLTGQFTTYFSHLAIALGIIHLILKIFIDFEMGIIKLIPMKIHGYIELIVAVK
jgi:hypothetical protein